jgi:hypothetical protein
VLFFVDVEGRTAGDRLYPVMDLPVIWTCKKWVKKQKIWNYVRESLMGIVRNELADMVIRLR